MLHGAFWERTFSRMLFVSHYMIGSRHTRFKPINTTGRDFRVYNLLGCLFILCEKKCMTKEKRLSSEWHRLLTTSDLVSFLILVFRRPRG